MLLQEIVFLKIAIFALVILGGRCEDNGPGYGNEWLYYLDDHGTRHIMNFSSIPKSTHGMSFGDAFFNLYTRNNIASPELLTLPKSDTLQSIYFNKSNNIKVITHGWISSAQVDWLQKIKDSLLREHNLNVITVDWSQLANNKFYPWPALSTRYVGKRIAKLLKVIQLTYNIGTSGMHLIGHSLGAQVMGYAGMFLNGTIPRITGLDPARPLFELPRMPGDFCLDKNDAEFVDIIHTAGGTYGYRLSHGHADFYPNKGTPVQPGCQDGICSHGRACEFYDESISYSHENGFIAYLCAGWDEFTDGKCSSESSSMGHPASSTSRGNYYLSTRNESKYAFD